MVQKNTNRIYSIKRRGVKKILSPSDAELLNFKIKSHKLLTDNNYDKLFENKFQCLAPLLWRIDSYGLFPFNPWINAAFFKECHL